MKWKLIIIRLQCHFLFQVFFIEHLCGPLFSRSVFHLANMGFTASTESLFVWYKLLCLINELICSLILLVRFVWLRLNRFKLANNASSKWLRQFVVTGGHWRLHRGWSHKCNKILQCLRTRFWLAVGFRLVPENLPSTSSGSVCSLV